MGLQGKAALVGAAQYKPEKYATAPQMFHLEQISDLTLKALDDAGMELSEVDGLITTGAYFHEASSFVPAMVGEYLGVKLNFAEVEQLAVNRFGHGVALLNKLEASGLIDELLGKTGRDGGKKDGVVRSFPQRRAA